MAGMFTFNKYGFCKGVELALNDFSGYAGGPSG
jgi:hypothetical protein